jgi:hypothetical protein
VIETGVGLHLGGSCDRLWWWLVLVLGFGGGLVVGFGGGLVMGSIGELVMGSGGSRFKYWVLAVVGLSGEEEVEEKKKKR